ncbi:Magnesium transporter protein 1 [Wickerhamomyces ciferrii]|uniref:Magnesium transporter protein 1 n=1 Tax=Wickerhamomyces ciferrii (strain ATCC 14091 / BCRC 22168 / CBS 111 / JCM 3599 / NBRC 0793 / NRRL Y-1031 F-60-10) TaxID=1206466 RepID=K0KD58_WICCF|nr:Magnesium transporter protein 1 [Wickerhamomyces ciferrii]CCH40821.1 Magnesium transporter protein 1 [Wickerhamomyces ciferrii]
MNRSQFLLILTVFIQTVFCALSSESLNTLKTDQGIIYLNNDNFHQIITGDRDYYLSVLFTTTSEKFGCDTCKKFDPQYKLVSKSFHSTNPESNDVFFTIVEFETTEQVFRDLGLKEVPKLWVFPPTKDPNYNVTSPHFPYTISESALNDPLDFASFITKISNTKIIIQPDFEISSFALYFFATFFSVLILKKKILNKVNKSIIIRFIVVLITTILVSGYMFTVIRGIPLIAKDDKGHIMYFSGGQHWQFGLETFVITGIYLSLGGLIVGLTSYIPKINDDVIKNSLTLVFSFGVFYIFNYLTKIFLVKDPGYPYQLTKWL